jgi:Spy/CpxP family protein refolding chaperone
MIKHCLLALMLAGLIYAASPSAIAQDTQSNDQSAPPAGGPPEHGRGHFDPARQTEMLTKQLNLTSEQQPKVLEILKSEQSQMQSLRSDTSLSQQDRRAKMMEIRKTSNDQVRALLDSDQQKKWDEMQARREQRGENRQHGQGGPPSSSDQQ